MYIDSAYNITCMCTSETSSNHVIPQGHDRYGQVPGSLATENSLFGTDMFINQKQRN